MGSMRFLLQPREMSMRAEPKYWVYENGPTSGATIHVSYCHHCNDGQGVKDHK